MRELIGRHRPGETVIKIGGEPSATFDTMSEGVYGDLVSGMLSPAFVVVSAPGRDPTDPKSEKVTDFGIQARDAFKRNNPVDGDRYFESIASRFLDIVTRYNLDQKKYEELLDQYYGALRLRSGHPGIPEIIQGHITADIIPNAEFIWPDELFAVDPYGRIIADKTIAKARERLRKLNKGKIGVTGGFVGEDYRGHSVETTRGGSDASGAYMARALQKPYLVFTNTPGILSADPKIVGVDKARHIDLLAFRELHSATQGGSYIVHVEGVRPVEKMQNGQLEVWHYKDYKGDNPKGTIVLQKRRYHTDELAQIISVTAGGQVIRVVRRGAGANDGFEAQLGLQLHQHNIPVKRITTDASGATIITERGAFPKRLKPQFRKEVDADTVELQEGIGVITIVGLGLLRNMDEVMKRVGAMAKEIGVYSNSIASVAHGSALNIAVPEENHVAAVGRLHEELIEKNTA